MLRAKNVIKSINRYRNTFKNYKRVIWSLLMGKYPVEGILYNGELVKIPNSTIAWLRSYGIDAGYDEEFDLLSIEYNGTKLTFSGAITNGELPEVFFEEDYGSVDYSGKTVIDIGANIGDSSIYFVLNGARKVISFEPFPNSFKLLKKNIFLNNMQESIFPFMAALGKEDGKIKLDSSPITTTGLSIRESTEGEYVEIFSFKRLTELYAENNSILKLDCEGCEYDVFKNSPEQFLEKYDEIIIEYHNGDGPILSKLSKNWNITIKPKSSKIGIIMARKGKR